MIRLAVMLALAALRSIGLADDDVATSSRSAVQVGGQVFYCDQEGADPTHPAWDPCHGVWDY